MEPAPVLGCEVDDQSTSQAMRFRRFKCLVQRERIVNAEIDFGKFSRAVADQANTTRIRKNRH